MNDPVGEERKSLPASPILIVATSDAKLRLYTFGSIKALESVVVLPQPLPKPAPLPSKPAVACAPAAGGLEALTQAAKAAGLPSDDDDDDDGTESSDTGGEDEPEQQFRGGSTGELESHHGPPSCWMRIAFPRATGHHNLRFLRWNALRPRKIQRFLCCAAGSLFVPPGGSGLQVRFPCLPPLHSP